MRIERRYSMEALAEILRDEEIRNGNDAPPPLKFISLTLCAPDAPDDVLIVVFDDNGNDD